MSHFVSFPDSLPEEPIENLVITLVDPATDAGAISRMIAHSLSALDGQGAAFFNTDPLVDYRAQRPWLNFSRGALVGLWHEGMLVSHARDMEGTSFLHLRGIEPDFRWEALTSDMLDIVERYGVRHLYSFTAIASTTPHTRPADMVVRSSHQGASAEVLDADFWFQASFASYLEYKVSQLDLSMTNVAVRVPMYLTSHHYSAGAAAALAMVASISGLRLPVGDLEHDAANQADELAGLAVENEELGLLIASLEKEYDEQADKTGFVTAPQADLAVPSAEEIGRAAEQFLAGTEPTRMPLKEPTNFDPQGLIRRIDEFRRRQGDNGGFGFSAPLSARLEGSGAGNTRTGSTRSSDMSDSIGHSEATDPSAHADPIDKANLPADPPRRRRGRHAWLPPQEEQPEE